MRVKVCYESVQELVPKLLQLSRRMDEKIPETVQKPSDTDLPVLAPSENSQRYDLVVHIGLAPGRSYYSIETCAHRDGYVKKDVRGALPEGNTVRHGGQECPAILQPSLDLADIWRRWKDMLQQPEEDVRPSDNAGRYLCEFVFYTSMLEFSNRDPSGARRCMFLHVPSGIKQADLARGTKVVLALIAALVGSEMTKHSG